MASAGRYHGRRHRGRYHGGAAAGAVAGWGCWLVALRGVEAATWRDERAPGVAPAVRASRPVRGAHCAAGLDGRLSWHLVSAHEALLCGPQRTGPSGHRNRGVTCGRRVVSTFQDRAKGPCWGAPACAWLALSIHLRLLRPQLPGGWRPCVRRHLRGRLPILAGVLCPHGALRLVGCQPLLGEMVHGSGPLLCRGCVIGYGHHREGQGTM
mmetsp:Transcript_9948/g.25383  ORF Transcript_9948/g.25383 Transcript_9948/m.25383 type:complete len:210 (+) Transcript_9948:61-690(+)